MNRYGQQESTPVPRCEAYISALIGLSVIQSRLNTVIPEGVSEQFLEPVAIQELLDEHLACALLGDSDALQLLISDLDTLQGALSTTYLLDDVGTELLHRQGTDVPKELADDSIAEAVVVEVQDVLDNLRSPVGTTPGDSR